MNAFHSPRRMSALSIVLLCSSVWTPATATVFHDVRGSTSESSLIVVEYLGFAWFSGPGSVEMAIPRIESILPGEEMAVYNQEAFVDINCIPPADIEDRTEWFTRLWWRDGSIGMTLEINMRTGIINRTEASGIQHDLSRLPGAYYTSFTPTIQYVPGIADAVHHLESTQGQVNGVPQGDIGLAQRWMAYIRGVVRSEGNPMSISRITDAASAWNAGAANSAGMANVFASGMRTMGIPACVILGYVTPAGPLFPDVGSSRESGFWAWSGVWSEGYQAFIPIDVSSNEFGFVDSDRAHFVYHEDLANHDYAIWCSDGGPDMSFGPLFGYEATGSTGSYQRLRMRHVDDGFSTDIVAHDVIGFNAPGGGTTGVDESSSPPSGPEKLLVSNPFRETLSASLILDSPARATVELFDVQGRLVQALALDRAVPSGETFFRWLPRDAPYGVYFVRVTLDGGRKILSARAVRRKQAQP